MRKKILLLSFLCYIHAFQFLQAQFTPVAESEKFDEPQKGDIKLIQLANGHTFFYWQHDKSISLQLFDDNHKKLAEKKIEPGFGLNDARLNKLFEVKGDLVLFFSKADNRIVKLFRLVIDGNTGNTKEETQVEEFTKVSRYAGMDFDFGYDYVNCHALYVAKDIQSDHYAVVKINVQEEDKHKRVEIILFDSDHRETSRTFYASAIDEGFKFTRIADMVLYQQDKVALLMSGFNKKRTEGREPASYLAVFSRENGKTNITDLKLEVEKGLQYGSIQYNPVTKQLVTLARAEQGLIVCDPGTGNVIRQVTLGITSDVHDAFKTLSGGKSPWLTPQQLIIHDDGSYAVLCEDFAYFYSKNGGPESSITSHVLASRYTVDLQLKESYLFPKSHWLEKMIIHPFYVRDWARSTVWLKHSNAFKSFSYLDKSGSECIVYNDIEANAKTILKGKITNIKGVSESDAFAYKLTGFDPIPQRDFLFKNIEPKNHELLFTPVSVYDRKRNLYISMKLVKGKAEGVSIVWLSPK
jgi:hypothetical protein